MMVSVWAISTWRAGPSWDTTSGTGRLVIHRNASVSERLWRLVTQGEAEPRTDARWLGQMPASVWNVVRDGVLKCS